MHDVTSHLEDDDLESKAEASRARGIAQAEEIKKAEAPPPRSLRARVGHAVVILAIVLLTAVFFGRWAWTEAEMTAQQQVISELAAQVEELGGVPVATAAPPPSAAPLPQGAPENGTNGTNGEPGPSGPPGPSGAPGRDGANGTNGEDGTDGVNGTNGEQGVTGQIGERGPPGERGPAGEQGPPGVGIASTVCDDDGQWIVTLTDGTVQYPGRCRADPAPQESPTPPQEGSQ